MSGFATPEQSRPDIHNAGSGPKLLDRLGEASGTGSFCAVFGAKCACPPLRVKDIDFERNEITVRDGKGQKDRVTMLPAACKALLLRHLEDVRHLHEDDLRRGLGRAPHCPTRWRANISAPTAPGPGNTSSRPPGTTPIVIPASNTDTTSTNR